MTAVAFKGDLKQGTPDCKDIPYPQLKAAVEVDWTVETSNTDLNGKTTTTSETRKGWWLHECHGCGYQWICEHAECGDRTHGCTRSSTRKVT